MGEFIEHKIPMTKVKLEPKSGLIPILKLTLFSYLAS